MALLPLGLGLQLAASFVPSAVESAFSRGLFPVLGGGLACLTAGLPFSLTEIVLTAAVAAGLWLLGRTVLRIRSGSTSWREALRAGLRLAGVTYGGFLLLWGLNYQRQPFAFTAGMDARPASLPELTAVAEELLIRADALRAPLAEDARGVLRLKDGARGALGRAEEGYRRAARIHPVLLGRCARPKPVLASTALSLLGISGFYFPFTGEANVNTGVPDAQLPFDASHELAHQGGFAREDEANYLGYLACRLHPDRDFQYSGALAASLYTLSALAESDRAAARRAAARRSAAVRRDLAAIAEWVRRYQGPVRDVSERVNDAYLRSQGQRGGVRSYGRMVDLLVAEHRAAPAGSAGAP